MPLAQCLAFAGLLGTLLLPSESRQRLRMSARKGSRPPRRLRPAPRGGTCAGFGPSLAPVIRLTGCVLPFGPLTRPARSLRPAACFGGLVRLFTVHAGKRSIAGNVSPFEHGLGIGRTPAGGGAPGARSGTCFLAPSALRPPFTCSASLWVASTLAPGFGPTLRVVPSLGGAQGVIRLTSVSVGARPGLATPASLGAATARTRCSIAARAGA